MNRIDSLLETYIPKSHPKLTMDQARYRAFRDPGTPSKVEKLETTINQASEPLSSPPSLPPSSTGTDSTESSTGSAPPTAASSFDYFGVAVLTVLSGLALAAIAGYIQQNCCVQDTIPETFISYFDQRTITYNSEPNENIFHESSAIQKAINLYSDSLNIEKSSSWLNWIPSSLGVTDPDILHISHQNNPDVAMTCNRLSSSNVACSLDSPLPHEKGSMNLHVEETVEPFFSSLHESISLPATYWGSHTIEKNYQINSNDQLPDLFSQVLSPGHLSSWKTRENTYTFPTQFAKHSPVN